MLSNYSSDLLFSMERLSTNPYKIVRLSPSDTLPFAVKDAAKVSGQSLDDLHAKGQLFYVDHSNLKDLPQQDGKYSAACEAYFYINSKSKDFLPLAIKPNVDGSNWVVTPKDKFNDWLLAKMMFESNDMWYLQWFHLAATHEVVEIVYLAAIRTLSEEHPIMPVLHRILKLAFAFRPAASQVLLAKGAVIDQLYPFTGATGGGVYLKYYVSDSSADRYRLHERYVPQWSKLIPRQIFDARFPNPWSHQARPWTRSQELPLLR
jgi:arachidonate 15-lipoxygenase (second type)/8-lipoxygenase (S-type)